ncbi:MAG: cyclic pyranopterin phosphate synthase MoaA [SAR202 cluster bacterium Io17-Chloro-G2]|nr:MAG: cyclic pyranopterin phosphate synthase MoaA [SAR202 cluster bacterium Io17-Chloro-G2]
MIQDQFGRRLHDLRISVTDRCNFRCPYCMPAEVFGESYKFLPKDEILTFEEIARLTGIFAGLGVSKIRVTGGEPLLRTDLHILIGMLAEIDGVEDLTLTTNGYLLTQRAQELKDAGLKRITVSLDTLDNEIFRQMNGRGFDPQRVLEGIQAAADAGLSPIKINSVVQKGVNDHTLVDLARHFKGTGHIVRFIEYMDVGNRNGWKWDQVVPAQEIVRLIDAEMPLEPAESNYPGEVASRHRYLDGQGEIGVIASVTQPFCAGCTRARISTDGQLFTCLFASRGLSLRDPLRDGADDAQMTEMISNVWSNRTDRYSEERTELAAAENAPQKVEMYQIGG